MGSDINNLGAVDVTALMQQARLQVPSGTVTVQGTVNAVWESSKQPTQVYGDLRGFDGSVMSFRCPADERPRKDEPVVLRGTLTIYRSTQHRGFDLQLTGNRIGTWVPVAPHSTKQILVERGPKLSLERYLAKAEITSLVLIGTKTGIDDARTAFGQSSSHVLDQRITATTLDSLMPVIAEAAKKYDGLCLLRGGGEPDSFATWNDHRLIEALIGCGKPFYTALGHTSDVTLADKYADESLPTPSILGSTCKDAWQARSEREQLERRLALLSRANRELKASSMNSKETALNSSMGLLQRALDEFQKLNAKPASPTSQTIQAVVEKSMSGFNQQIARKLQFSTWGWLCSIFLLGFVLGGFGVYLVNNSGHGIQSSPASTQTVPSDAKPAEMRSGKNHHGHSPS